MRDNLGSAVWRLGIFVVVSVLGLFALLAIFAQLRFQQENVYQAEFTNITGEIAHLLPGGLEHRAVEPPYPRQRHVAQARGELAGVLEHLVPDGAVEADGHDLEHDGQHERRDREDHERADRDDVVADAL